MSFQIFLVCINYGYFVTKSGNNSKALNVNGKGEIKKKKILLNYKLVPRFRARKKCMFFFSEWNTMKSN